MSWGRKLLWAVLALVGLGVAVAAYLLATFDPNRYKALLIERVQQDHQRTLRLDGPIQLAVWPTLRVQLQQVTLSEHQRPEQFAAVDRLDLALQVMPLLKGQWRVDRVEAAGVRLRYLRDPQGRSNIDDFLKDDQTPDQDRSSEPVSFEVAGIDLKQVTVDVKDDKLGVEGHAVLEDFNSGRLADRLRSEVRLKSTVDLTRPRSLSLRVNGALALTPDLAQQRVLAENVDLQVSGSASPLRDLKSALTAASLSWSGQQGALVIQSLAVRGGVQLGAAGGAGGGTVIDEAAVAVDRFELDPAAQRVQLHKLTSTIKGRQGDRPMEAELTWPELDIRGQQLTGSAVQGRFLMGGPVQVDSTFASQPPSGGFTQLRLPALTMDFKVRMAGQGGERQMTGQWRANMTAQPQASRVALDDLVLTARVQEPALQPLQMQAQGSLAGAVPGTVGWKLAGQLNANPFNTDGDVVLGSGVPRVRATARFATLDLNRLLPVSEPAPQAKASGTPAGTPADPVVDLSGLRAVDGRLDFSAQQLAWQHFRIADARAQLTLDEGHLTLSHLSGAAWKGRFKAQGSAQVSPQRLALQGSADGVDIHALLMDVARKDVLEGTGQVALNVQTSGRRLSELTAGLHGTASTRLRDGAVKGINLARSLREAKAKLSGKADAVEEARQTEKTDFTEMSASFQIDKGVAVNKDLEAKSPFLRVGGDGQIDLVRRRVDYTVQTTITGTVKGQDGADIEGLKGLTVPVRLSGPFDALGWKIQWSSVAVGSMQNTVKSRLETELKNKLLGKPAAAPASAASSASAPALTPEQAARKKLQDKLKGLFK